MIAHALGPMDGYIILGILCLFTVGAAIDDICEWWSERKKERKRREGAQ